MSKDNEPIKHPLEDQKGYVGNVFGWKFSLISFGIILFFSGLMYYKHRYGGGLETPSDQLLFFEKKKKETPSDTLKIE